MIDRIRLTAAAKNQLTTIKRKTGIEHYNSICRHAMCLSLANPSDPPPEKLHFAGGLEIDWTVLTGNNNELFYNLAKIRSSHTEDEDEIRGLITAHIHRGLSYLFVNHDLDALIGEID